MTTAELTALQQAVEARKDALGKLHPQDLAEQLAFAAAEAQGTRVSEPLTRAAAILRTASTAMDSIDHLLHEAQLAIIDAS